MDPIASKQTQRLVLAESIFDAILDYALRIIFALVLMVYPAFLVISMHQHGTSSNDLIFTYAWLLAGTTVVCSAAYKYSTYLRMTTLQGRDHETNQALAHQIINKLKWNLEHKSKDHMIATRGFSSMAWSHQITIVFDGPNLLFNSFSMGQHGIRIPISFWEGGNNLRDFHDLLQQELAKLEKA
ncbi:MAG: hypothetical protein AAGB22_07685 [Bacteroidota bacterium]